MADPQVGAVATVYASTWVPGPSPFAGYGADGFAVAWVDTDDGRIQVLVADASAPPIGATGTVEERTIGEGDDVAVVPLFTTSTEGGGR